MRKSVGRRILIHHNIPVDLWRPNPMLNSQAEVHFDRLLQYGLVRNLRLAHKGAVLQRSGKGYNPRIYGTD